MSLFKILQKNFEKFPDKTALIIENKKYSYKEFFELTVNTINNLKINNFKKESKVIIIEDNSLTHVLSIFALSYINSTIVPTGKYYSNNHLLEIAKITKVNGIIANSKYCNYFKKKINLKSYLCINKSKKFPYFYEKNERKINLKKKIDTKKNFIITMSSGSTAKPKPIVFSQNTKIIRFKLFKKLYKINKKDVIIVTCPIDHSLGMRILLLPFLIGATCLLMRKFLVSSYCKLIKNYSVTFSVLVANQIYELIKNKKNFKDFFLKKCLVSASEKLFEKEKQQIIKRKINLHEMYGATEIGTITSINISKNKKFYKSVGKSYNKKISIKILSDKNKFLPNNEIGEIVCKTPAKFKYYLNSKKLNKDAYYKGYFKTGDIGYLDKKKYLYFLSRKKNIIRRNGLTIYPEDIENVILKNKNIKEAAVIGTETRKESLIYLFIKKNNKINEQNIKNILLKKLSTFQIPNKIIFLKNIPKTNLGKINRKSLSNFI
jgi:acyl-CoA synthetase (AMP-forming)/AMP-acid ligase II